MTTNTAILSILSATCAITSLWFPALPGRAYCDKITCTENVLVSSIKDKRIMIMGIVPQNISLELIDVSLSSPLYIHIENVFAVGDL
jgi:hypothetical protein